MNEFILVGKRKRELTPRMKRILELKNLNYKSKEIAEMLGIKKNSVDVMRTQINKRLRMQKGNTKLK